MINLLKISPWIPIAILLTVMGCGGGKKEITGTVSGKATLDGKALAEGCVIVCQHIERGLPAGGTTAADGTFKLSMKDLPGLVVGDYKVMVQTPEKKMTHEEQMKLAQTKSFPKPDDSVVPEKYRSFDTSNLKLTVKAGANTFDVPLMP